MSTGAHNKVRKYLTPGTITNGQKAEVARYLGAWPQTNNLHETDILKHVSAMRTGFYAFYGIWSSNRIRNCPPDPAPGKYLQPF